MRRRSNRNRGRVRRSRGKLRARSKRVKRLRTYNPSRGGIRL